VDIWSSPPLGLAFVRDAGLAKPAPGPETTKITVLFGKLVDDVEYLAVYQPKIACVERRVDIRPAAEKPGKTAYSQRA